MANSPETRSFLRELCGFLAKCSGGLKLHRGRGKCVDRRNGNASSATALIENSNDDFAHHTSEQLVLQQIMYFQATIVVVGRIPAGARSVARKSFKKVVDRCLPENSEDAWFKLLTFCYAAFKQQEKQTSGKQLSFSTLVKQTVAAYMNGDSAPPHVRKKTQKTVPTNADATLRKDVNLKIQHGNVSGAARRLSSEEVLAPFTAESLAALQRKHPEASKKKFSAAPAMCQLWQSRN